MLNDSAPLTLAALGTRSSERQLEVLKPEHQLQSCQCCKSSASLLGSSFFFSLHPSSSRGTWPIILFKHIVTHISPGYSCHSLWFIVSLLLTLWSKHMFRVWEKPQWPVQNVLYNEQVELRYVMSCVNDVGYFSYSNRNEIEMHQYLWPFYRPHDAHLVNIFIEISSLPTASDKYTVSKRVLFWDFSNLYIFAIQVVVIVFQLYHTTFQLLPQILL